jgi:hypothetical protein
VEEVGGKLLFEVMGHFSFEGKDGLQVFISRLEIQKVFIALKYFIQTSSL